MKSKPQTHPQALCITNVLKRAILPALVCSDLQGPIEKTFSDQFNPWRFCAKVGETGPGSTHQSMIWPPASHLIEVKPTQFAALQTLLSPRSQVGCIGALGKVLAPDEWPVIWHHRSAAALPQPTPPERKHQSTEYPLSSLGPGLPLHWIEVKPMHLSCALQALLSPRTQV